MKDNMHILDYSLRPHKSNTYTYIVVITKTQINPVQKHHFPSPSELNGPFH